MKNLALAALVLAALTGCVTNKAEPVSQSEMKIDGLYNRAYRFEYVDGLECVVVMDAGISCDWENKK